MLKTSYLNPLHLQSGFFFFGDYFCEYSSVHHKVKKNKKDKNKNYSKNLRKKNQELENKLRIVTNLLEAYLETVNGLRRDLELERGKVTNLR